MSPIFSTSLFKYISGGLGAALLLSNALWYVAYDIKDDSLKAEVKAHTKTKTDYKAAQDEALIKQLEYNLQKERENAKKAKEADVAYDALLRKYNASILRYEESQRATGKIDLSGTTVVTEGDYRSSTDTRISISLTDAQICAVNTARLGAVYEWSKTYGK